MTTHLGIASVTAVLALLLGLFFVTVARVPGWRHYRTFSLVAFCTSFYCGVEIFAGNPYTGEHWQSTAGATFSLMLALASGVVWICFDVQQESRPLAVAEKAIIAFLTVGVVSCAVPGLMFGDWQAIPSPLLGFTYHSPATSWVADTFITVLLVAMLQLMARYAYRAWTGSGSWLRFCAAGVFVLGEIEEGLAATGVAEVPFLGGAFWTLGIVLMSVNLGAEVSSNAKKLASLNLELKARISKRTSDLVTTREALMATERHVALGQLAAGVGHEVNNPLSYVKGNLDFLREQLLEDDAVAEDDDAIVAIDDALHGAERIRLVVDNLTSYARSAPVTGAAQVPNAIDVAMRVVRPKSKFTMVMNASIGETTPVAIDESRLIQILVNLLINTSETCREVSPPPAISITSRQDHKFVVIEISDQGSGMDESPLARIVKSVHNSSSEQRTWGFFLCRSLVEAAGGTIEVQAHGLSATTIAIRLIASGKDFPSISEVPRRRLTTNGPAAP